MKIHACSLIPSLCLLFSTPVFAYEHSGGYHGASPANSGYHNYGYHNNDWNGGGVIVNTWDDNGILYDDNLNDDTSVVVGVPDEGYYDPSCQTIDNCSTGTCVLVNTCE